MNRQEIKQRLKDQWNYHLSRYKETMKNPLDKELNLVHFGGLLSIDSLMTRFELDPFFEGTLNEFIKTIKP